MLIYNLLLFFAFCFLYTQGVYEEVCMWKTFKANCSEDEVIVVEKAIYGQGYNSSRCANGTTDVESCSFDVHMYFDRKCGGRQACKIEIPNKDLSELKGLSCKSQRNLYLAISFNCEYVYLAPGETCSDNQSLTVSTAAGLLSSIVAVETNKGSSICPWKFRLNQGQSVRFSMLDFGLQQSNQTTHRGAFCRVYAIFVLHHGPGQISESVACGGDMRQKHLPIDVSSAREVDILLKNLSNQAEDATSFLIKFKVFFRCPEYIPPANASVTKTSNGLLLTCLMKPETNWTLQCVDGRWKPDPYKSCDDSISAESTTSSSIDHGIGLFPKWFLTVLPAGIVLPVGIMVSVGIFWIIRKQRRQTEGASNSCSSAHHYSDVDIDHFTPEMMTDTIVEAPDAPVYPNDSTTLMPYLDLKHPLAAPMPAIYSGLQNDNLMIEDLQHNNLDDPSATRVSVTPPYANVVSQ